MEHKKRTALEVGLVQTGCVWLGGVAHADCAFTVTLEIQCPEKALFALRRKRSACKAALRHRRITAPRSAFSGILKLGSGERRRYPMLSFAGFIWSASKRFVLYVFLN